MKKCIYCNSEISDNRSLDVCDNCGLKVWGEKMFNAIIQNMNDARDRGDLFNSPASFEKSPSEVGDMTTNFR